MRARGTGHIDAAIDLYCKVLGSNPWWEMFSFERFFKFSFSSSREMTIRYSYLYLQISYSLSFPKGMCKDSEVGMLTYTAWPGRVSNPDKGKNFFFIPFVQTGSCMPQSPIHCVGDFF
jgi:hypothetical protein